MKTDLRNNLIFGLAALAGLIALPGMALHTSQDAEVMGRWSLRWAYLLGLAAAGTLLLAALGVPAWRRRLLRRSAVPPSRRLTRIIPACGLLLLPVAYVVLVNLLPVEEGGLTRVLVMLTLCGLCLPTLWFIHRSGAGYQVVTLRNPAILLLLLTGLQLVQVALWIGLAPQVHRQGDLLHLLLGVRQAADAGSFILTPDRNAETWFNFPMVWPVAGHYMRLFGVGINQARFFCLLLSALALPFIGLSARRLYGNTAALCALAVGIAIPLQYNWVRADGWVATATAISLYLYLRARESRKPLPHAVAGGFVATSAVEGHVYGGALAAMFVLLWLRRWFTARHLNDTQNTKMLAGFLAGCLLFSIVWAGYHIALPGTALTDVPGLIRETLDWETAISNPTGQVGLTPANILLQLKIYLYSAPAELVLLAIVLLATLKRRNAADRLLLFLAGGALAIVGLFLGHVNDFYLVFVFSFFAIGFGAWLSSFFREGAEHAGQGIRLSLAGLFVLLATILLYALFAHARSLEHGLLTHRAHLREMESIGREIDAMLPPEDVVVAGDPGYYPGMPQRLNYASNFSFTWNLPKYWAFDDPKAIIVTLGVDDGYSDLDTWLVERDFRAARCFAIPGLGEGVTILYLAPELTPPESAVDCTAQDLLWMENA